jgi:hypothetical protein
MEALLLLDAVSEEFSKSIEPLGGQLRVIGLKHLHSRSGKLTLGSSRAVLTIAVQAEHPVRLMVEVRRLSNDGMSAMSTDLQQLLHDVRMDVRHILLHTDVVGGGSAQHIRRSSPDVRIVAVQCCD